VAAGYSRSRGAGKCDCVRRYSSAMRTCISPRPPARRRLRWLGAEDSEEGRAFEGRGQAAAAGCPAARAIAATSPGPHGGVPMGAHLFEPASASALSGARSEGKGRFLWTAEAEGRGDEVGEDDAEDGDAEEEPDDDTRAAMAWRSTGRTAGQLVAKRAGRGQTAAADADWEAAEGRPLPPPAGAGSWACTGIAGQ
jgi:hypothetical protein